MEYFDHYCQTFRDRLTSTVVTVRSRDVIPTAAGIEQWVALSRRISARGRIHYFVGNGASATMASHMALDGSKNAGIRALAFNDIASLTALGNDLGYEQTFAQPLLWHGQAGDLLIAISSSGRSPNILAAIQAARDRNFSIVTLTGLYEDNPGRHAGDLNFFVPGRTYGMIECAHQVLLHCWLDHFMALSEWDQN